MPVAQSLFRRHSFIKLGLFFVVIFAAVALRSASASAATCGVHTYNVHSLAGLVVESYWWPYSGGTLQSNNTQVHIWTISNGRPLTGDIVHLNAYDQLSGPRGDDYVFNQYSSGCGNDGYNVVLGYNQTSTLSNGYPGPWALDCEASRYGVGNEQWFGITGVGVPTGARPGGTWEVKSFQSKNGYTGLVTIAYREPPPPDPAPLYTFDGANCTTAWGWAFDPSKSSQSLWAHLQVDGNTVIWGMADQASPDVDNAYGISGNHRFALDISSYVSDGASHTISVYTYNIDSNGNTTGGPILIGSKTVSGCSHPATLWTNSSGSPPYIDPSQAANFTHTVTITNYGGQNAGVSVDVYRSRSGGGWVPVRDPPGWAGGYFVTGGNYTVTVWNGSVPTSGSNQICQMEVITNAGGANIGSNNAVACVNVRGGSTTAATTLDNPYIEQSQTANLGGQIVTSGFAWAGSTTYPVTCSYAVTQTLPSASPTTINSGNCSQNITNNGTIPVVNYTYNAPPNVPIGTTVCVAVNVSAGDFGGTTSSTKCTTVVAKPYFDVLGGDIVAGANFVSGTTCTNGSSTAGIKSWNNGSYPFFGAATELAALAMGDASYFASATDPIGGGSTAGQGNNSSTNLTLANTTSPVGQLGGLPCMPDYYSQAMAIPGATALTNGSNIASFSNTGTYQVNGSYVFNGGTISPQRQAVTLVVNGDVYITGNVHYTPSTTLDKLPRFTLIAKGNIYIDRNVTELHGAYIAESNGTLGSGTVYTCSTGLGAATTDYATCNQQLIFYGAVAANQITLGRSYSSLHSTLPGNHAAEVFQYSPELWLANGVTAASGSTSPYDAITSLPPTL